MPISTILGQVIYYFYLIYFRLVFIIFVFFFINLLGERKILVLVIGKFINFFIISFDAFLFNFRFYSTQKKKKNGKFILHFYLV